LSGNNRVLARKNSNNLGTFTKAGKLKRAWNGGVLEALFRLFASGGVPERSNYLLAIFWAI
jgi:hypothetical protein